MIRKSVSGVESAEPTGCLSVVRTPESHGMHRHASNIRVLASYVQADAHIVLDADIGCLRRSEGFKLSAVSDTVPCNV